MKICLVSRKFDKNRGSAEWIYAHFLKEELAKRGFEVYTIEQKNVDIKSSRYKKMFYDFFILPVKLLLTRLKGVKTYFFISENQAIYVLFLNISGAKTFTYFHDLMRIKSQTCSLDKRYFSFVYRQAVKSTKIICNSSFTKEDIIRTLNVDPKKIEVIPPIYRKLNHFKKRKHNHYTIGYLGALNERKRPCFLIKLAEEIKRRKANNIVIEVWGKGEEFKNMRKEIKKKDLSNIYLKGFAPEEEIEKSYNSFDFFVFPSKYEGFGLPILEAAMCGVPSFILKDSIIPQEIKELTQVCKNEKEIIDKILFLIENRKEYEALSKKTVTLSKKFNKNVCLNKVIRILKK